MTIKEALRTFLAADAGVAALVDTRIYARGASTKATLPYITIVRIANPSEHHMTAAAQLARATFQITCWASGGAGADALSDAVREAVDGYQGLMGGALGVDVRTSHIATQSDDYSVPDGGQHEGDSTEYGDRIDLDLGYFRSVPTF